MSEHETSTRCKAITLPCNGEAQCARDAVVAGYCKQHAIKEGILVWCGYCDEYTTHGTTNCVLPIVN